MPAFDKMAGDPATNWDLAALQGAGAILSSAGDLAAFGMANFDSTNKSLALQRKATFSISDSRNVALGWFIEQQHDGHQWHMHNGGTGGYRSSMILDESNKRGIVILSNISAGHKFADDIDTLAKQLLKFRLQAESMNLSSSLRQSH
ncbi:MAG: serine hydrolase domain-containing protein [Fodinibius sp.]|nr:serine hydrolase domain-containing protein [Fodinibius sp.]